MAGVGPEAAAGRARRLPSVTLTKASLHVDVISLSGTDGSIGNLWSTAPQGRCRRLYAKMTMMAAQKDAVDTQSVFHSGLAALSAVS